MAMKSVHFDTLSDNEFLPSFQVLPSVLNFFVLFAVSRVTVQLQLYEVLRGQEGHDFHYLAGSIKVCRNMMECRCCVYEYSLCANYGCAITASFKRRKKTQNMLFHLRGLKVTPDPDLL